MMIGLNTTATGDTEMQLPGVLTQALTQKGDNLNDISNRVPLLLIFLRHFG